MSNELAELAKVRIDKVDKLIKAKQVYDDMEALKKNKAFKALMKRYEDAVMEAVKAMTDIQYVSKEQCNDILIGYSATLRIIENIETDYFEFANALNQHDAYVAKMQEGGM